MNTPQDTRLALGRSAQLPRALMDQAMIKHLHALCKARGVQVPDDIIDLMNRATCHYVNAAGQPADVVAVMLTWEE